MTEKATATFSVFSTEGPTCPGCQKVIRPDEAYHYDETGFDEECPDCGLLFRVHPAASWSWTTKHIEVKKP